jgi:hypothetical protein
MSYTWSVGEWSVFMLSVRTNNDCEGWHRRLNVQARRSTLPFYTLVALLHEEARLVDLTAILVSEKRLKRYQKTYTLQSRQSCLGRGTIMLKAVAPRLLCCVPVVDSMIQ